MRKGMEIRRSVETEHEMQGDTLVGYAALFESDSPIYDGVVESISRSAFTKTVREASVVALFNHDPGRLLGRSGSGTLRLSTDKRGLHYEIDLGAGPTADDVRSHIERGDLVGSSFAGRLVVPNEITEDGDTLRVKVREVALRDVGPVTFPYYPDTSVELRGMSDDLAIARHLDPEDVWERAQSVGLARAILGGEIEAETKPAAAVVRRHRYAHLI